MSTSIQTASPWSSPSPYLAVGAAASATIALGTVSHARGLRRFAHSDLLRTISSHPLADSLKYTTRAHKWDLASDAAVLVGVICLVGAFATLPSSPDPQKQP
jgi:hypothetical protein